MILLLDNYDSFTWNLYHYLVGLTGEEVIVKRNDAITVKEAAQFSSMVLSPGPGLPSGAGIMPELIAAYSQKIPMLGICLGHQALAEFYGAKLKNLPIVLHGVQREVFIELPDDRILKGLPSSISTGHYHSWVVSNEQVPHDLVVTASDNQGDIMALSHSRFPWSGVQFHPESVMTQHGHAIIENWLNFCSQYVRLQTIVNP